MKCSKCNAEVPDDSENCPQCNARFCLKCKAAIEEKSKFCSNCGEKVPEANEKQPSQHEIIDTEKSAAKPPAPPKVPPKEKAGDPPEKASPVEGAPTPNTPPAPPKPPGAPSPDGSPPKEGAPTPNAPPAPPKLPGAPTPDGSPPKEGAPTPNAPPAPPKPPGAPTPDGSPPKEGAPTPNAPPAPPKLPGAPTPDGSPPKEGAPTPNAPPAPPKLPGAPTPDGSPPKEGAPTPNAPPAPPKPPGAPTPDGSPPKEGAPTPNAPPAPPKLPGAPTPDGSPPKEGAPTPNTPPAPPKLPGAPSPDGSPPKEGAPTPNAPPAPPKPPGAPTPDCSPPKEGAPTLNTPPPPPKPSGIPSTLPPTPQGAGQTPPATPPKEQNSPLPPPPQSPTEATPADAGTGKQTFKLPPAGGQTPPPAQPGQAPASGLPGQKTQTPPAGGQTPPPAQPGQPPASGLPGQKTQTPPAGGQTPPPAQPGQPPAGGLPGQNAQTPPAGGQTPPPAQEQPPSGGLPGQASPDAATPPSNQNQQGAPSAAPSGSQKTFRKHVTVLAVDLKGSTEKIQSMDPEEAREILYPVLEILTKIVNEHGGVVIFTEGDGLIAVFGAPKAMEDHALRACISSEEMHRQIQTLNFLLRVGLHSGEVLLEESGDTFQIVGAVVNLAVRMQQITTPGKTRITAETYSLIADSVTVDKEQVEEVKGFSEPIVTYELMSIKVSKSISELEKQFTERTIFVNRTEELKKVNALLEQAIQGKGNIVSLCAEGGLGKSRFIFEIINSEAAKQCIILLTAAFIHTKEISLLPITNLFRGIFKIIPGEANLEEIKKRISPYLVNMKEPHAMSAILALVNINPNDPEWDAVEPAVKKKYIFEIGAKLILSFAQQKPLILIIEDLHWIDTETELFIDLILSSIEKAKVFVCINYRPEYYDHWTNKPHYEKIDIKPLDSDACENMLYNLLGNDPSLKEIKEKLLGIVEGNPFFLEELTTSLITKGVFVGETGNYKLKEGTIVKEIQLPESVATIYQNKIDNLEPMQKATLQFGSVIGTKFPYSQILALSQSQNETELKKTLDQLCRTQYLYEAQLYPEPIYSFMHAVTLESSYNSILKKTRKVLHGQLLDILEKTQVEGDEQGDQIQIMSEHAHLAERWDKALQYSYMAAKKVYEISAFSTAAKLFERALIAASHYPESIELSRFVMQLHYELYYTYVPVGKFKEQEEHLQKALEIAKQIQDRFFESVILSAFAIFHCGFKDALVGLENALAGYNIAKEIDSMDAKVIAQFTLVHVYLFLANFPELFKIHQEMEATAPSIEFRSDWLRAPMGHITLNYTLWGHSMTGDFNTTETRKEQWFAASKNLDEPSIPNMCRFCSVAFNEYMRKNDNALEYASKAYSQAQETEVIIFVPIFAAIIAEKYIRQQNPEEGKPFLEHAVNVIERIHGSFTSIFAYSIIIRCYLLLGDFEKANTIAQTGLEIATARNLITVYKEIQALWAETQLNLQNPNMEELETKLQDSLKEFQEKGMLPYLADCHVALSKLYEKMQQSDKQQNEIAEAKKIYDQIGIKT